MPNTASLCKPEHFLRPPTPDLTGFPRSGSITLGVARARFGGFRLGNAAAWLNAWSYETRYGHQGCHSGMSLVPVPLRVGAGQRAGPKKEPVGTGR